MTEWIVGEKLNSTEQIKILNTNLSYYYDRGDKFLDDKAVVDSREIFLLLDGVIFNKKPLMLGEQQEDWAQTLLTLYRDKGIEFIGELRGSFNGVIVDKVISQIYVFVDQLGERPVFYHENKDSFFVTSNFNEAVKYFKSNEMEYSVDKEAIKQMLYFGYMVDNRTCISEIKRIFPGSFLYKDNMGMEEKIYFQFENRNTIEKTDDEIIELIDEAFIKALKQELDKDREYGYHSLMDISGGMDARTACFAAKKLSYDNIVNLCYSQMNAYEKKITEDIIRQLGNDYIFKSLDNASFIYKVDELVRENYGLSYFIGITGGRDFLKILDKNYFGIEHTGILGDVYEGSFNEQAIYEKPYINPRYRFSKLLDIDLNKDFLARYEDNEVFKFYTRGILAGTSTHLIRQKYFETYSPFEDIDFLKLMFEIPLKQRIDGKIYMKWVNKKYPEALKNIYAGTMCNPNSGKVKIKLRVLCNILLLKVILPFKKKINYNSEWNYKGTMNPVEYWYEKNEKIRVFMNQYYEENIDYVEDEEINEYLKTIQKKGNVLDKMVMMTVLSIYKQYIFRIVE